MINRTSKRALAILMMLAMLLSLFPAVFAAEGDDDPFIPGILEEITVTIPAGSYKLDVGGSVYISDVQVSCNTDSILSYKWSASPSGVVQVKGDGANATITAKSEGTAYVTLTVSSPSGTSDSDTVAIYVQGSPSIPVTARANGSTNLTMNASDSQTVSVIFYC